MGHCQVLSLVADVGETPHPQPHQVQAAHGRKAPRTLTFQAVHTAELLQYLCGPCPPGPRELTSTTGNPCVLRVLATPAGLWPPRCPGGRT